MMEDELDTEEIVLEVDDDEDEMELNCLGIRLCGSQSAGVFVKDIVEGSPAHVSNRVKIGDQLVRVNEIRFARYTPDQVVRILRQTLSKERTIRLTVIHSKISIEDIRIHSSLPPVEYNGKYHSRLSEENHCCASSTLVGTKMWENVQIHQNYYCRSSKSVDQNLHKKVTPRKTSWTNYLTLGSNKSNCVTKENAATGNNSGHVGSNSFKNNNSGGYSRWKSCSSTSSSTISSSGGNSFKKRRTISFSPKKIIQYWSKDDGLLNLENAANNNSNHRTIDSNRQLSDDNFQLLKPRSFYSGDIKALLSFATSSGPRLRRSGENRNCEINEELPLVGFEQVSNQLTPITPTIV